MFRQGIHVLVLFDLFADQAHAICVAQDAAWLQEGLIPRGDIRALEFESAAHARCVASAGAGMRSPVQDGLIPDEKITGIGGQGAYIGVLKLPVFVLRRAVSWVTVCGHDVHAAIERGGLCEWNPSCDARRRAVGGECFVTFITVWSPARFGLGGIDMPSPEIGQHGIVGT